MLGLTGCNLIEQHTRRMAHASIIGLAILQHCWAPGRSDKQERRERSSGLSR